MSEEKSSGSVKKTCSSKPVEQRRMTDQEFLEAAYQVFAAIKQGKKKIALKVHQDSLHTANLKPITVKQIGDQETIKALATWRKKHAVWFPAQFEVTLEGTGKWLENQVIGTKDRLLFMIYDLDDTPAGHMGFFRFTPVERACEIDNIVRGRTDILPGTMTSALNTMLKWGFGTLGLDALYLRVFSENKRAVALYKRCGFEPVKLIPLLKEETPSMVKWVEAPEDFTGEAERSYLQMKLDKKDFIATSN